MSTDKSISTEEEVLLAFAVEEQHNHLMLERYIKQYPQYTTALVDCSIEFFSTPNIPNQITNFHLTPQ